MTSGGRRIAVVVGAMSALLLVVLAASTGGFWATRSRAGTLPTSSTGTGTGNMVRIRPQRPPRVSRDHVRTPQLHLGAALWVVVAILVVLVLVGLVRLLQSRSGQRNASRARPLRPTDAEVAALRTGAADARSALDDADPRTAVLRCWVLLEEAAERAGGSRGPAETSAEFAQQVLRRSRVDPAALETLHALYRRARFSDLPVDEADRADARAAVERVAADVGRVPAGAGA